VRNTVAGKLTLLIAATLVVFFGLATWLDLIIQERAGLRILRLNGAQLGDMVVAAARDAMLHNDREQIQKTITAMAEQREVERIRVVVKGGQIAYSTEPDEVGRVLDTREEQCLGCHQRARPPETLPEEDRTRIVDRPGGRVLGITQVIRNEPDCSNAACHAHSPDESLLGVLDINLRLEPYDEARRRSAVDLLLASLVGILAVLGITVAGVQRMVHRPVQGLIRETDKLGHGDLSARVPEGRHDELGTLAETFNRMAHDLEAAHTELLGWTQSLEQRVEEKTSELERAQEKIVQVERMASLGRLAAVVAHEINNPLSSVVTYAKILVRRLQSKELDDECRENLEYLESIASEASRCGEIVAQLLSFARRGGGEFTAVDINQVVDRAVFLTKHTLELAEVSCELELEEDMPTVRADPGQIQQALMALLINAGEAVEKGGRVQVTTTTCVEGVEIAVEDDGPGMDPDVARRVFEPFFTTKDGSSGVGLGLAVVYGIVERHGGKVELTTAPGKGCRFAVVLPIDGPGSDNEERRA